VLARTPKAEIRALMRLVTRTSSTTARPAEVIQTKLIRAEQSWKIQPKWSGGAAMLHRGGGSMYKSELGYINREEVGIALAEPDIGPVFCPWRLVTVITVGCS